MKLQENYPIKGSDEQRKNRYHVASFLHTICKTPRLVSHGRVVKSNLSYFKIFTTTLQPSRQLREPCHFGRSFGLGKGRSARHSDEQPSPGLVGTKWAVPRPPMGRLEPRLTGGQPGGRRFTVQGWFMGRFTDGSPIDKAVHWRCDE